MKKPFSLNGPIPAEIRAVGDWIAAGLDHAKHVDWTGKVPAEGEFCGNCWPWDIRTRRDFTVAWQILWTLRDHMADELKLTPEQKQALNYLRAAFAHVPATRSTTHSHDARRPR